MDKKLSEEPADILFVLICMAKQTGVDLTESLKKIWKKKQIVTVRDIRIMKSQYKEVKLKNSIKCW